MPGTLDAHGAEVHRQHIERGFRAALHRGRHQRREAVYALGLHGFDVTVCGDEVDQGKPHPEIFLKAASALNCLPEHCLMLEDSQNGLLSAIRAGGQPILIEDIKPPAPEVAAGALKAYTSMHGFLGDLNECMPDLGTPALTESFPPTLNQFSAGIHGFGAMGGGYLTQIFSHWDGYTRPCEIIAATRSRMLRETIQAFV